MLPYFMLITGVVVLIADLFATGGLFLPFGISFILTGVVAFFTYDIFYLSGSFVFFSILFYGVLFLYNKMIKNPQLHEIKEGIVQDTVGDSRYVVMFPTGFRGETVWEAYSDEELKIGDKVRIKGMDGNVLIVEKVKN